MEAKNFLFSDEQTLQRTAWMHKIKNLMGRFTYYDAMGQRQKIIDELWSHQRDDVSFGMNCGFWIGMDSIRKMFAEDHEERLKAGLSRLRKNFTVPDGDGVWLAGTMSVHPLTTPMVEIAADGRTAQGLWYSIGFDTEIDENGFPKGSWKTAKYAADFIYEDNMWRIWHLLICSDLYCPAGVDYGDLPPEVQASSGIPEYLKPDLPIKFYDISYRPSAYPPEPLPYYTFSDTVSYGPDTVS